MTVSAHIAEEVARIERELMQTAWIPSDWRMTEKQKIILNALVDRPIVSRRAIFTILYGDRPDGGPDDKIIDVYLFHIRKRMEALGFTIINEWGRGWRLPDEARVYLKSLDAEARAA